MHAAIPSPYVLYKYRMDLVGASGMLFVIEMQKSVTFSAVHIFYVKSQKYLKRYGLFWLYLCLKYEAIRRM